VFSPFYFFHFSVYLHALATFLKGNASRWRAHVIACVHVRVCFHSKRRLGLGVGRPCRSRRRRGRAGWQAAVPGAGAERFGQGDPEGGVLAHLQTATAPFILC
jgi:hypothetical protein